MSRNWKRVAAACAAVAVAAEEGAPLFAQLALGLSAVQHAMRELHASTVAPLRTLWGLFGEPDGDFWIWVGANMDVCRRLLEEPGQRTLSLLLFIDWRPVFGVETVSW